MPGFSAVVKLSELDGANGFRINGETAGDSNGHSVSNAGDVNGDGIDDLIVSSPVARGVGSSYVVFGRAGGFAAEWDLSALDGRNGFRLDGEGTPTLSGFSVSDAGDVNGDGFDDLIVGAPEPGDFDPGASYVVFGRAGGFPAALSLSALDGGNGFRMNGVADFDASGSSVSGAGDVNGDGFDDVIIGAPNAGANGSAAGASYVVFGKAGGFPARLNLVALDGSDGFRIDGAPRISYSGHSVSAAGDVNGDGVDDLIIGAPEAPDRLLTLPGKSYVVFGRTGGFPDSVDVQALNGRNGFSIVGEARYGQSGFSVSSAGDVNGDGVGDLIIGQPQTTFDTKPSGASYVVFGRAGGFSGELDLSSLKGANGFRIDGGPEDRFSGASVSSAGDVNGDGFDDLLVGAPESVRGGSNGPGAAYVVFGRAGGFKAVLDLPDLDGSNGFRIDGEAAGDRSGFSVSAAGDVNGDGVDDLLVGAPDADAGGNGSGASYVIFGIPADVTLKGTAARDRLAGRSGNDTLSGLGGNDRLDGGRGDDALIGGVGRDTLNGGAGDDRLFGRKDRDILLGGADDDRLVGGRGEDRLAGGDGADRLTGGAHSDTFVFESLASRADTITDFSVAEDTIVLDRDLFGTPGATTGTLNIQAFKILASGAVVDADDRVIYDPAAGTLTFDADGSGTSAAVLLARIGRGLALTADDFIIA